MIKLIYVVKIYTRAFSLTNTRSLLRYCVGQEPIKLQIAMVALDQLSHTRYVMGHDTSARRAGQSSLTLH